MRFPLGQLLATPAALRFMGEHCINGAELIRRHASGDWGDLGTHDRLANEAAIKDGTRIFSSYRFGEEKIWEKTVRKLDATTRLDTNELTELAKDPGAFRIGVERAVAPIKWKDYLRQHPDLKCLARAGKKWGANPKEWFISLQPVKREHWRAVQVYVRGKWAPATFEFD